MNYKILICAFACVKDPDTRFGFGKGGESGLGWNTILQISKFADVSVLTDAGNKQEIEEKMTEAKITGVNFYYISLPKFLSFARRIIQIYAYLWQIKAYFVAKKLHKKFNFDIFHHITYANDWMASYIGALLPIPYIRGPSGGAHKVPKAFLKNYTFEEKLVEKIRSVGQWIFRHDPFFIISQNRVKKILVCNKEAYNALKKNWREKAEFFPVNGISKEDLSVRGYERVNGRFKIITAGKLLKIKSFDLAIKTFEIFNKKFPESEFIIVGDGPELEKLKKLAGGRVKFEKWMLRKKLLEEIAESDVFLFPSLRDGGGQVVVEAMAQGKPVICFDISGPGFHVDENCGIKIKPDNSEQAIKDMASALEKLYVEEKLRLKLGEGAKKKVENFYNWDKLGERMQKIYESFYKK